MKTRKFIALLLAAVMLVAMTACAGSTPTEPLNVYALKGPTGVSMAKLAVDASGSDLYNVNFAAAPDEISGKIIKGEVDIACVPTNLAAVLNAKTEGGVKVAAVTTLGVLYLLDTSGTINSVADLKGKSMGATGQGSNPEYILNYILEKNSLTDEVTVNYYADHAELASLMVAGTVTTGMLPEPFVTQVKAQLGDAVNVIDLQAEWSTLTEGVELAQGVIVVRSEVLENNEKAVEQFLADFKASSEFAVTDIDTTAQYCEQLGIIAKAAVAKQAIPRCNITCVTGDEMKTSVNAFLQVLFDANAQSVGGAMPSDEFYYVG